MCRVAPGTKHIRELDFEHRKWNNEFDCDDSSDDLNVDEKDQPPGILLQCWVNVLLQLEAVGRDKGSGNIEYGVNPEHAPTRISVASWPSCLASKSASLS